MVEDIPNKKSDPDDEFLNHDDFYDESEEDTRVNRIEPMLEEWKGKIKRERWITDGEIIPDGKGGKRKTSQRV